MMSMGQYGTLWLLVVAALSCCSYAAGRTEGIRHLVSGCFVSSRLPPTHPRRRQAVPANLQPACT